MPDNWNIWQLISLHWSKPLHLALKFKYYWYSLMFFFNKYQVYTNFSCRSRLCILCKSYLVHLFLAISNTVHIFGLCVMNAKVKLKRLVFVFHISSYHFLNIQVRVTVFCFCVFVLDVNIFYFKCAVSFGLSCLVCQFSVF